MTKKELTFYIDELYTVMNLLTMNTMVSQNHRICRTKLKTLTIALKKELIIRQVMEDTRRKLNRQEDKRRLDDRQGGINNVKKIMVDYVES